MAHIRQSRPDCCRGFQVTVLETFYFFPTSIGSGPCVQRQVLFERGEGDEGAGCRRRTEGVGFRVEWFRVWKLASGFQGLRLKIEDFRCMVQGLGFHLRAYGLGFRVQGLGYMIKYI